MLGPLVSLDTLRSAITTLCIERLSYTWHEYDTLLAYKDQHGDCNVPGKFVIEDEMKMGRWAATQRTKYKSEQLNAERIKKLEAIELL